MSYFVDILQEENAVLREETKRARAIIGMTGTFLSRISDGETVSPEAAGVLNDMISEFNKRYNARH